MTGPFVAGVGFRHGTGADEIAALIARALALVGAGSADLAGVATAENRASEPSIHRAAARFGLRPSPVGAAALEARDGSVVTRSARIERLRAVGSVAEAAALAAAGPDSRLVLPRIASGGATCALAVPQTTKRQP